MSGQTKDINVLGVTISHENILDKNYSTIISKAKKVLMAWQNRDLTLLGKVQVVNTLIASLFVHKMMVLPQIPDSIKKAFDNLVRDYIWKGKKAKIAYSILQNSEKEGGLNLVDLSVKDKSLKATWPQILSRENEYASLVYYFMRCKLLKSNIWRCNLAPQDARKLKFTNSFWKDVLVAWCEYNYYQEKRVENQVLWYNSQVRIQGKPFCGMIVLQRVFYLFTSYLVREVLRVLEKLLNNLD